MSEESIKKSRSIRFRLLFSFVVIIGVMIAILLIFNYAFLEKLYLSKKQNDMKEAYADIGSIVVEYSEGKTDEAGLIEDLNVICSAKSLKGIIVESGWNTVYTNERNTDKMIAHIRDIILTENNITLADKNRSVIEKTDVYTLLEYHSDINGERLVELCGNLSESRYVLLTYEMTDMIDTISVINTIILIVGLIMLGITIFLAFIYSSRFTKPIRDLSHIAKRMSVLDFDARYTGDDKSEIGLLGQSMNDLSAELEKNITKLKSANIELQKDIENKEMAHRRQNEFLSDVSHELKTPIAIIEGYAEALKEGIARDPETMREYCDIIIDESNKMNVMVRQLLSIKQMESDSHGPEIERFSITDMVRSVINANLLNINKKGIEIVFDQKNEDVEVWADQSMTEQVITNYVTNAINHSNGKIRVYYEPMDSVLRLHVWNSGENIPESHIDEIWNKFYKVDKARTREYGGNGIGLSIVKAIMEQHGRDFGVKNTADGVDFWCDLDCGKK